MLCIGLTSGSAFDTVLGLVTCWGETCTNQHARSSAAKTSVDGILHGGTLFDTACIDVREGQLAHDTCCTLPASKAPPTKLIVTALFFDGLGLRARMSVKVPAKVLG